ncbi:MAG: biliverdin-producing heme oxygenase [Phycisphaerae bacterium]|nr:biliverdin-producing heme oxygenase [Phycisphaerae bacterium]
MQTQTNPVMQHLKRSTQSLHDETEAAAFNKLLVTGRIPLPAYIDLLGQLLLIHQSFESLIRAQMSSSVPLREVIRDYQFQVGYLLEDLAYFGREIDSIVPRPTTTASIAGLERIAAAGPIALLGIHYVFEGSNNGSRFIARSLRRTYQLDGTNGTRYFDPYGDRQPEYWAAFKADMAKIDFTAADLNLLVEAAREGFSAVKALHASLEADYCAPGDIEAVRHAGAQTAAHHRPAHAEDGSRK